jgi:hypothetical protein
LFVAPENARAVAVVMFLFVVATGTVLMVSMARLEVRERS